MKKFKFNALERLYSSLLQRLKGQNEWQRVVKSSRAAMGYLIRVPYVLLGGNGRTWVLALFHFCKFAQKRYKASGSQGLAIYLKACQLILLKYLAGEKVINTRVYGAAVGLRGRIPSVIPKDHRKYIRNGDRRHIRFWLTLFGFYRIVEFKGRMKISTITDPGKPFDIIQFNNFLPYFQQRCNVTKWKYRFERFKPELILKSAPGSSNSKKQEHIRPNSSSLIHIHAKTLLSGPLSLTIATFLKKWDSECWYHLKMISKAYGSSVPLYKGASGKPLRPFKDRQDIVESFPIGKLGLKEEPGKVRVFAMVDWWTQMMLKPVHIHIQDILKRISQDATFDQDKAVREAIKLSSERKFCASYDLSAATDRLPVVLQSIIMNLILPGYGQVWADLLVDRNYYLPGSRKAVRYSVGQPMGALSSWVMLALTHHFIVQFAAFKKGWVTWFPYYKVLGDDIVIFDKEVSQAYLEVMKDLGVDINLSKSLVSNNGTFEFAKRFIYKSVDVSPLSFRELDASMLSLDALSLLVNRFEMRKLSPMLRVLGFGYKPLSRLSGKLNKMSFRLMCCLVWLTKPLTTIWSKPTWIDWLSMKTLSGSSPKSLHLQAILDTLNTMIETIRPTVEPVDDYEEVTSERLITGYSYEDGKDAQSLALKGATNLLFESITREWGLLLGREAIDWFAGYEEWEELEELSDKVEKGLVFFNEFEVRNSSLPSMSIDLSVRLEPRIKLSAGRWLRNFLRFKKKNQTP